MGMFGNSKANGNFLKIGPFWYPLDFYDLQRHHLLGRALKQHFELEHSLQNYDYLMAVKDLKAREMPEIYETFMKSGARRIVNVGYEARQPVVDLMEQKHGKNLTNQVVTGSSRQPVMPRRPVYEQARAAEDNLDNFAHRDKMRGNDYVFDAKKLRPAFNVFTNETLRLVNADTIGEDTAGRFWKSPMFEAIQGWRERKFWRKWVPNGQIPKTRLTNDAFQKALAADGNNATLAQAGVTQQEMDDFLTF